MKRGSPERKERLAAALRENLKRRRARVRALALAGAEKARKENAKAPPSRREEATKRD